LPFLYELWSLRSTSWYATVNAFWGPIFTS
jgi:hypothetical protein